MGFLYTGTIPMKHHASNNWGNRRKDPEKGIRTGEPTASRNAVKVLLSGSESESLEFVRRHADNRAWLRLADEIEFAKDKPRGTVLTLIKAFRNDLEGRVA